MNSTRTIHGGWRRHHEGMKMGARHCTLRRAVQRIERLGYKVTLEAAAYPIITGTFYGRTSCPGSDSS